MASGKSSVGAELASSLGLGFFDLDQTIENEEEMLVSEIFSRKGEIYFRKKEGEILDKILEKDSFVLSTGGGTPCYGKNMETILIESTHSFYLQLSIPSLVERLRNEAQTRPLVSNLKGDELPEFIGKHLFERSFFYSQAKETVDCNGKQMNEIVEEIKRLL